MMLRCSRPPLKAALLGLCLLLAGARGGARELGGEPNAAERLFREGRELLVAGRFAEACPRLEQSQRLEPRLGTLLNIAFCQQRLGRLATAWLGFRQAQLRARAERDAEREQFAREQADALQPRVPQLRLRAAVAGGAAPPALTLDGAPLAPAAGAQELPLDPGEHILSAASGGQEYWRTRVTLREAEHSTLLIPAPPPAPAASSRQAAPAARLVYELGALLGFSFIATSNSTPDQSLDRLQAVLLEDGSGTQRWTCANADCEYLPFDSGNLLLGVTGFVGYALAPGARLGARFLGGPLATGGALLALGPSASFQLGQLFHAGPTLLLGTASHGNEGLVVLRTPGGEELNSEGRLRATLGMALGVGAELGLELLRGPAGSLALQAQPLFLFGENGTALCLPLGVAYRWD